MFIETSDEFMGGSSRELGGEIYSNILEATKKFDNVLILIKSGLERQDMCTL